MKNLLFFRSVQRLFLKNPFSFMLREIASKSESSGAIVRRWHLKDEMRKSLKKLETLLVAAALMLSATMVSEGQTESIIVSKKHTVRELRGVVLDIYDEPLAGVDVAVFDNAGWIQEGKTGSDVEQRLMAATTTDANGRFNFKHLPAGKYEVRFRLTAFNDIHFLVLVKPHGLRNKKLVVTMKVAT